MSKQEYLNRLREELAGHDIPNADQMTEFYAEMIDDRMEEGMSEEEAVSSMEEIDSIVSQALMDRPIAEIVSTKVKESHDRAKERGHGTLWLVLVILGFPVWFPLLAAFFTVLLALYVVLWAVVISLFAVEFAFAIAAAFLFIAGFSVLLGWIPLATTVAGWGIALVLAGLFLLLWKPVCAFAGVVIRFIRRTFRGFKGIFARS